MAVGIYLCLTTKYIELLTLVIPLGTFGLVPAIVWSALEWNFERNLNGQELDLSCDERRQRSIELLTEGNLKENHASYYRRNGGLKAFVKHGFMLPDQADRVRSLLQKYDEESRLERSYTRGFFTSRAIQANRYPARYAAIFQRKVALNKEW